MLHKSLIQIDLIPGEVMCLDLVKSEGQTWEMGAISFYWLWEKGKVGR